MSSSRHRERAWTQSPDWSAGLKSRPVGRATQWLSSGRRWGCGKSLCHLTGGGFGGFSETLGGGPVCARNAVSRLAAHPEVWLGTHPASVGHGAGHAALSLNTMWLSQGLTHFSVFAAFSLSLPLCNSGKKSYGLTETWVPIPAAPLTYQWCNSGEVTSLGCLSLSICKMGVRIAICRNSQKGQVIA